MKTLKLQFLVFLLGVAIAFTSCEISDLENRSYLDLPGELVAYGLGIPDEIPTLGRVLFYDPRLSANNAVSCSSCHQQRSAFSDNRRFSLGFKGELTTRNSMPIQNIVSTAFPLSVVGSDSSSFKSTSLFWDGRQQNVISMVMEPIQNHIEMGISDLDDLMDKIESIPDYKPLFAAAFGNSQINKDKVSIALSAFVVSIRSTTSRFDMNNPGSFTTNEQAGFDLFFGKYNCNSCHQVQRPFNGYQFAEPIDTLPSDPNLRKLVGFADIGLEKNPTDVGAQRATGNAEDKGKFKIASLRNVAVTAPYMHDGRFETLEDVLDHYSNGIEDSPNLDQNLRESDGTPKKLNITGLEKAQIIAFLRTMTDVQFLNDGRFANPFHVR